MRKLFILYLIFFLPLQLLAQDTLPKISVINISNNILISWTNPFVTLTTINIQRSFDSSKNFSTIGSVLDVANKTNGLIDAKPASANMYYRLFLSFEGGTYIFTKSYRPVKDTTKVLPDIKEFQQSAVNTWFVASRFIYTGKDNNIIISLPGVPKKKYNIKFFEENGALLFEINKITEPYLTVEKVNFLHAGIFDFELYENDVLIERHKIYIPKDVKLPLNKNEQGKNLFK